MPLPVRTDRQVTVAQILDSADVSLCELLNRASRRHTVSKTFCTISRLGDGVIWYAMMAVLPLIGGYDGVLISLHMVSTALVGLVIYKVTKQLSGRKRPYVVHADRIECAMAPLDRYSFPSGHTLHAVSFSMLLCGYFPQMTWVLLPFAILVGLSRMILGLHYPSDVLAGAFIGAVLARASFDVLIFAGVLAP